MTTYRVKAIGRGANRRYGIERKIERLGHLTQTQIMKFPNHGTSFGRKADADIVAYWLRKGN